MGIANFIKEDKSFEIDVYGFKISVKYRYCPFSCIDDNGFPTISHFEFNCSPSFKHFTNTGYKSHFFNVSQIFYYPSIEKAAVDFIEIICNESKTIKPTTKKENIQLSIF